MANRSRPTQGDSQPVVADWDGDGLLDLIVGCGDGSVMLVIGTSGNQNQATASQRCGPGEGVSLAQLQ